MFGRFAFTFFLLIHSTLLFSQGKTPSLKKLSPVLAMEINRLDHTYKKSYLVVTHPHYQLNVSAEKILSVYTDEKTSRVYVLSTSWEFIKDSLLSLEDVLFVDLLRQPREELAVSNFDASTNKATMLHDRFPQYAGNNITVSIKEQLPDTSDIDFKGRYIHTPFASPTVSGHATIMSTVVAGAGNTYYEGKGIAPQARISAANFSTLLPEADASYQQFNISVQNHSYGTGIENYYGADAMAYDASVITRPSLVHVFSAGNAGTQAASTGTYAGLTGFANLTGSFKMAKNILTVGHTDSLGNVLAPSSKGPSYDGRVKPELVAFGLDGSSGAAAIVSGTAATLQNAYRELHGSLPSSAVVRALLINGADDIGATGPDYTSGYGALNSFKAMQQLVNGTFYTGSVSISQSDVIPLTIPAGISRIRITLTWNDPPAMPNASKALKNDVDMELFQVSGGQTWQPWVLSHFPHADSLQLPAVRKRDSLNTIELITVDNPLPGNYQLFVNGYDVAGQQEYAVAVRYDTANIFRWQYPMGSDNLFPHRTNLLRWESRLPVTTGDLEYSLNNGSSWNVIANNILLANGTFYWQPPDTFSTAQLRMTTTTNQFNSPPFTISSRMDTYVGFNCPDSFQLYWNRQEGVTTYRVYQLGEKYMEPFLDTDDTAVVLKKSLHPARHYAVAPLLQGKTGVRSYGFDYTLQGVECYIRSFLVFADGNSGKINLVLGTTYNITRIVLERSNGGPFLPIDQIDQLTGTTILFTDQPLMRGLNIYRVRIELAGGGVVYSETGSIYYLEPGDFTIYPNPVTQGQSITVLSGIDESVRLTIYNTLGQKLREELITGLNNSIPVNQLRPGIYFVRFTRENGASKVLRLVIQ